MNRIQTHIQVLDYTHSPDPSTQYAILRKIRGSHDQALWPGHTRVFRSPNLVPQEQIPWERGCAEKAYNEFLELFTDVYEANF
jgi:hypothetical protein